MGGYVSNSLDLYVPLDRPFLALLWLSVVLGVAVLVHSFYLYRFTYKIVRLCTDLTALAAIINASCFLICINPDNGVKPAGKVVLLNFIANAICACLTKISDNYFVYNRYAIVKYGKDNVPKRIKAFVFAYSLIFLYLPWLPYFTIVPFFVNLNDPEALEVMNMFFVYFYVIPYAIYDIVFTGLVIYELKQFLGKTSAAKFNDTDFLYLAYKSIAHNVLTCTGMFSFAFWLPYGYVLYSLLTLLSLHFLFNWKVIVPAHKIGSAYYPNSSNDYVTKSSFYATEEGILADKNLFESSKVDALEKLANIEGNTIENTDTTSVTSTS